MHVLKMATCSEEKNIGDIYHDLISDHKDIIIREIDIDQVMTDFPYKDAISQALFTKLFNETDKEKKSKRFINSLLRRSRHGELKAFFNIVTEGDPRHYLRTVLRNRQIRFQTAQKNKNPDDSSYSSVEGSSIKNDTTSEEDPQSSSETEQRSNVWQIEWEKRHLEEDLDTAQRKIQEKDEVVDMLRDERNVLHGQLQEAKKEIETMQNELLTLENVNSELRNQLQGAKENVESLQNKLIASNAEMTDMREEINDLKDELSTVNEELKELKPLKTFLNEPKKSKTCLVM